MKYSKAKISYLLMTFIASEAMGSARPRVLRELKNGVSSIWIREAKKQAPKSPRPRHAQDSSKDETDQLISQRRALIKFVNQWGNKQKSDLDYVIDLDHVVAEIDEKRAKYERVLEVLVERVLEVLVGRAQSKDRELIQAHASAFFSMAILWKDWNSAQKITAIARKGQWNKSWNGYTPMQYAILSRRSDCCRFCIDQGVHPNDANTNGETVLMTAAAEGTEAVFRTLLDFTGIDFSATCRQANGERWTALDYARRRKNAAIIALLKSKIALAKTRDDQGSVSIGSASARSGHGNSGASRSASDTGGTRRQSGGEREDPNLEETSAKEEPSTFGIQSRASSTQNTSSESGNSDLKGDASTKRQVSPSNTTSNVPAAKGIPPASPQSGTSSAGVDAGGKSEQRRPSAVLSFKKHPVSAARRNPPSRTQSSDFDVDSSSKSDSKDKAPRFKKASGKKETLLPRTPSSASDIDPALLKVSGLRGSLPARTRRGALTGGSTFFKDIDAGGKSGQKRTSAVLRVSTDSESNSEELDESTIVVPARRGSSSGILRGTSGTQGRAFEDPPRLNVSMPRGAQEAKAQSRAFLADANARRGRERLPSDRTESSASTVSANVDSESEERNLFPRVEESPIGRGSSSRISRGTFSIDSSDDAERDGSTIARAPSRPPSATMMRPPFIAPNYPAARGSLLLRTHNNASVEDGEGNKKPNVNETSPVVQRRMSGSDIKKDNPRSTQGRMSPKMSVT
jgi:hypothetical protein